jgi:hypothetical protein
MLLGGDYGTALCAACANGNIKVVNALLLAGVMRNGDGEQTNTGEQCRCLTRIRGTIWNPTSHCCTDGRQGNGEPPNW